MGISSFMALWSTGTITNGVFVSKSDEYIFASNERTSVPFFFWQIWSWKVDIFVLFLSWVDCLMKSSWGASCD